MSKSESHIAAFLARGASSDLARLGQQRLRSLSPLDAWWQVMDVAARVVLPETLERVPPSFVMEVMQRHTEPLYAIAHELRCLPPLPGSLTEGLRLIREASPLCPSRFLGSFAIALEEPGLLQEPGALFMAMTRWPHFTPRGHHLTEGAPDGAMRLLLEAIAASSSEPQSLA